jgi:hypothetical protein
LRFQCNNGYANAPQGYFIRTLSIPLSRPWYVPNTTTQEDFFISNKLYPFHIRRTPCRTSQTIFSPFDMYLTDIRELDVSCRNTVWELKFKGCCHLSTFHAETSFDEGVVLTQKRRCFYRSTTYAEKTRLACTPNDFRDPKVSAAYSEQTANGPVFCHVSPVLPRRPRNSKRLCPSGLPTKILYGLLSHEGHMPQTSHPFSKSDIRLCYHIIIVLVYSQQN